jgi:hypothetical protein
MEERGKLPNTFTFEYEFKLCNYYVIKKIEITAI